MTEIDTTVKQGEKEYTLVFKTTSYEYYKIMRQLGYMMVETDRKGSMKKKGE